MELLAYFGPIDVRRGVAAIDFLEHGHAAEIRQRNGKRGCGRQGLVADVDLVSVSRGRAAGLHRVANGSCSGGAIQRLTGDHDRSIELLAVELEAASRS